MTYSEAQQRARQAALEALRNGATSREAERVYDAVMRQYGYEESDK